MSAKRQDRAIIQVTVSPERRRRSKNDPISAPGRQVSGAEWVTKGADVVMTSHSVCQDGRAGGGSPGRTTGILANIWQGPDPISTLSTNADLDWLKKIGAAMASKG